jgi:hypothetical protein
MRTCEAAVYIPDLDVELDQEERGERWWYISVRS